MYGTRNTRIALLCWGSCGFGRPLFRCATKGGGSGDEAVVPLPVWKSCCGRWQTDEEEEVNGLFRLQVGVTIDYLSVHTKTTTMEAEGGQSPPNAIRDAKPDKKTGLAGPCLATWHPPPTIIDFFISCRRIGCCLLCHNGFCSVSWLSS